MEIGKYYDRLRYLRSQPDKKANRLIADDVLCAMLSELGYRELVNEYRRVTETVAEIPLKEGG